MPELRWILAALSALLLAGIWWWGARRSRQAPGNAALRESTPATAASVRAAGSVPDESDPEDSRGHPASRDWGVPPFEPLSIRTADFEPEQIVDLPMTAHAEAVKESFDLGVFEHEVEAHELARMQADEAQSAPWPTAIPGAAASSPGPGASGTGTAPRPHAVPPSAAPGPATSTDTSAQVPNLSEAQRIVTVRVCADGEMRWAGVDLMAALENHGLAHGRYQVFHRKHSDGRTLFCAASLIEPGTFNLANMPHEEYRGLTLFAVLPGPADPLQTFDALIETAVHLAQALDGVVQDSKGIPLSEQRVEALRDEVARFRASLTLP
ncbi:MAG: hypothetical protein JWN43_3463 [Gammaproteobacteria bacterium]|nr:hypothetical protein [Gammaproteobacteria bacterium]